MDFIYTVLRLSVECVVLYFHAASDAEEAYARDGGWEFITLADHQRMGIRTSGLEDKYTACQMLVVYARDLGDGFADYVEAVGKIMIPMLRFIFFESIFLACVVVRYIEGEVCGLYSRVPMLCACMHVCVVHVHVCVCMRVHVCVCALVVNVFRVSMWMPLQVLWVPP